MENRPMSRGLGVPPGTGMRTAVPRTGVRPGTIRQPTNFDGVGYKTTVTKDHRPVTQQGVQGIAPGTAGPGRQVQDTSYYTGVLRQKSAEISAEINRLRDEIDRFKADNDSYAKYDRRYEELLKNVRELEGCLADYNLARDKCRAGVDPEKVESYRRQLEIRNQQENADVDSIFLERQKRDRKIEEYEEEIQHLQQVAEDKINQLDREDRKNYARLMQLNEKLNGQIGEARRELEAVTQQVHVREREMERDNHRDEFNKVEKVLRRLQQEREELAEELEMTQISPDEARTRMLAKVKQDNAEVARLAELIDEQDMENERKQKQLQEFETELEERKSSGGNDAQKYEVLYQRDQEMTEFIEKFEGHKSQELAEQRKTKDLVVALLKHISQNVDMESNMDDLDGAAGGFTDASKSTRGRLDQELTKRSEELEKINSLGSKIAIEMKALKAKIDVMNTDIVEFQDIDKLRDSAEMTRKYLTRMKKEYSRRRDAIKTQLSIVSAKYEKKKNQLADNDTARTLEGLEQKLRHYEQSIFHLQEYIGEKERETDFQSQKEVCGRIIDELNGFLIESCSNQVLRPGSSY